MDGYGLIESFLTRLFEGEVGVHTQLAIWTLRDKKAEFFYEVDKAAEYAANRSKDTDVYFGCGLYEPPGVGRGTANDVHAITSVWADIDIADDYHKKKYFRRRSTRHGGSCSRSARNPPW